MSAALSLRFEILSYWRVGTGSTGGAERDAVCARDVDGLPYIPGRQVRGLLRDGVRRLGDLAPDVFEGHEDILFGGYGFVRRRHKGDDFLHPVRDSGEGVLAVTSARMLERERVLFATDPEARIELFSAIATTRIDASGVADDRTLRREEVAIPMVLHAEVQALDDAPEGWRNTLCEAVPLVAGVGARRTRGLGRVIVTCGGDGDG